MRQARRLLGLVDEVRVFRPTFLRRCGCRRAGRRNVSISKDSSRRLEATPRIGLTETARLMIGAGYLIVCTTFQSSTSYTLTIWSRPPVKTRLAPPSNVMQLIVFWWLLNARTHLPPAIAKSHTRKIGPPADNATFDPPVGKSRTSSTERFEPCDMVISALPVRTSHSLMVES
jgi:hypothetical protein